MARSLRSHTKKRTRAIKRETVFKPVEDARLERLAQAQADAAKKPSVGDYMEDDKVDVAAAAAAADNAMTEGEEEKKKISTSGPRSNRHARKLKEKKKKGKKSVIKF